MVGIWTLDVDAGASTADAAVARMYGLLVERCAQGMDQDAFLQAIHPEDRERVKASLAQAISSGVRHRSRHRLVDTEVRWVSVSAKPITSETYPVVRLLGVEITGQMETATALAESRFHFQTLAEALPQIVWSCDAQGRHDCFFARWSEFTGIDPQGIDEHTWKRLVYADHQTMVAAIWENALRTGEAYDIDYRFRHHTGEYRWLRVMALPIRDDSGQIMRWSGTSTDVHESCLMAEERERLACELERVVIEDQLTGVLTRGAFTDRVNACLSCAGEDADGASLLMLDIDHFKSINDTHGHPTGDKVLAATAQRMRAAVCSQDFTGRLGGEAFAVFLPQCPRSQTWEIAERIRRSVSETPVVTDEGCGIAGGGEHWRDPAGRRQRIF